MLDKDVTIGMKVVPHDKTNGYNVGLQNSHAWERGYDQGYLYVSEYELTDFKGSWRLTTRYPDETGGDFFNASDFEPLKKLYEDFHPMVTTDEFGHMIFG